MNKKDIEIHIENVSKRFKEILALDDVSMRFESGKLYGIIGPAGAGKTTLMRLLSGFYKQEKGEISFDNHTIEINYHSFAKHPKNELVA